MRDIDVSTDSLDSSHPVRIFRHPGSRTVVEQTEARALGASSIAEALSSTPRRSSRPRQRRARLVEHKAQRGRARREPAVFFPHHCPARRNSDRHRAVRPTPAGTIPLVVVFDLQDRCSSRWRLSAIRPPNLRWCDQPRLASDPTAVDDLHVCPTGSVWRYVSRCGLWRHFRQPRIVYRIRARGLGPSYREHSDTRAHGGLLKLQLRLASNITLTSTSHVYWEDVQIPGGMPPEVYVHDAAASVRKYDSFSGWRTGSSFKLRVHSDDRQEFQILGYYQHTDRASQVATGQKRRRRSAARANLAAFTPRESSRVTRSACRHASGGLPRHRRRPPWSARTVRASRPPSTTCPADRN